MAKATDSKTTTPAVASGAGIGAGTKIHLVLARGGHVPATITEVRGDRVDLVAKVDGEMVIITNSPLDETGKMPDSWHLPEPEEAGAKAEAE